MFSTEASLAVVMEPLGGYASPMKYMVAAQKYVRPTRQSLEIRALPTIPFPRELVRLSLFKRLSLAKYTLKMEDQTFNFSLLLSPCSYYRDSLKILFVMPVTDNDCTPSALANCSMFTVWHVHAAWLLQDAI